MGIHIYLSKIWLQSANLDIFGLSAKSLNFRNFVFGQNSWWPLIRFRRWTHQDGKASQEVVDEDDTADQVGDLQWRLKRLWPVDGWPALTLRVLYNYGGDVELVLVGIVAGLNGEGLEESNANADHAHGHAAANQQQKAHAEAQADLRDDEPAVRRVEAVDGVMPSHCGKCRKDEGHHPDAHHRVHRLFLGVAQPESTTQTLT